MAYAEELRIRNLDDATYAVLRARAAADDLSLTQYLRRELARLAEQPTTAEWLEPTDRWRAEHGAVDRDALHDAIEDVRAARK